MNYELINTALVFMLIASVASFAMGISGAGA